MPRLGSALKVFLEEAVVTKKYPNLYTVEGSDVCHLYIPRKDSKNCTSTNIEILKQWDIKRGHKFDYSQSRQRFESALKRSDYLTILRSRKDEIIFKFNDTEEVLARREKKKKMAPNDGLSSEGDSDSSSPRSIGSPSSVPSDADSDPPSLQSLGSPFSVNSDINMQDLDEFFGLKFSSGDEQLPLDIDELFPTLGSSDVPGDLNYLQETYLTNEDAKNESGIFGYSEGPDVKSSVELNFTPEMEDLQQRQEDPLHAVSVTSSSVVNNLVVTGKLINAILVDVDEENYNLLIPSFADSNSYNLSSGDAPQLGDVQYYHMITLKKPHRT